jgi:hypothetical protein
MKVGVLRVTPCSLVEIHPAVYESTLTMEVAGPSETSVRFL